MQILQVIPVGNECQIVLPNGSISYVTLSGSPNILSQPSWKPVRAIACCESVTFLEWESGTGEQATWYLDAHMAFICNEFAQLDIGRRRAVEATILAIFGQCWDQLICGVHPTLPAECFSIDSISRALLNTILFQPHLVLPEASSSSYNLYGSTEDQSFVFNRAGTRLRLERRFLVALLDLDFGADTTLAHDSRAAVASGQFMWPSPVDGRMLPATHTLSLADGAIAYRVTDDDHEFVFYVIVIWAQKAFVYIPAARQLYSLGEKLQLLATHGHQPIERMFTMQAFSNVRLLADYLSKPVTGFSLVLRLGHIGHHLWNELTETHNLLLSNAYPGESEVILMHNSRKEPLGRIEAIFPTLAGCVKRDVDTHADLMRHCYSKSRCIIEPTTFHIPRQLARSVVAVNLAQPEIAQDAAALQSDREAGYRIFMIGLRVENRTDTDLADFCHHVIEAVRQVTPRVVVVIDCINAEFGLYDQESLDAHMAAVAPLAGRYPDGNVKILNLAGASIARSLFWAHHASCFVAIWGAGLAKYLWLCNRPGLVVSSQFNLLHRSDLHIYDDPKTTEAPAPVTYIEASQVEDLPQAPTLKTYPLHDQRSTVNFHVNRPALRDAVMHLCRAHLR